MPASTGVMYCETPYVCEVINLNMYVPLSETPLKGANDFNLVPEGVGCLSHRSVL